MASRGQLALQQRTPGGGGLAPIASAAMQAMVGVGAGMQRHTHQKRRRGLYGYF